MSMAALICLSGRPDEGLLGQWILQGAVGPYDRLLLAHPLRQKADWMDGRNRRHVTGWRPILRGWARA